MSPFLRHAHNKRYDYLYLLAQGGGGGGGNIILIDDVVGSGPLGTDIATTVEALRGNPISATAPTAGQALIENEGATGSAWTSFAGDVAPTSTPGKLTVVGLQTNPISDVAATACQALIENAGATGSAWTTFSGDVTPTATPGELLVTGFLGPWVAVAAGATVTALNGTSYLVDASGAQVTFNFPADAVAHTGFNCLIKLINVVAAPVLFNAGVDNAIEDPNNPGQFSANGGQVYEATNGASLAYKYDATTKQFVEYL